MTDMPVHINEGRISLQIMPLIKRTPFQSSCISTAPFFGAMLFCSTGSDDSSPERGVSLPASSAVRAYIIGQCRYADHRSLWCYTSVLFLGSFRSDSLHGEAFARFC